MKQETLEEAVKKYSKDEYSTPIPLAMCMDFARFGAKWQQNKIDIFNARMEKERAENKAFLELHRQERLYSEEEFIEFGKNCFYKGFDKSENDDANCYTAFREEIGSLLKQFKKK